MAAADCSLINAWHDMLGHLVQISGHLEGISKLSERVIGVAIGIADGQEKYTVTVEKLQDNTCIW